MSNYIGGINETSFGNAVKKWVNANKKEKHDTMMDISVTPATKTVTDTKWEITAWEVYVNGELTATLDTYIEANHVRDKLTHASLHGMTMDSPGMAHYLDAAIAQAKAQIAQTEAWNHE